MEALVKCGVVMVSIALGYQHIEQGNRTMNEPDYTHSSDAPAAGTKRTSQSTQPMSAFGGILLQNSVALCTWAEF